MSDFSKYLVFYKSLYSGAFPGKWDFKDKEVSIQIQIGYMLDRLRSMFKWTGLPDTIPERMLELYLLMNGNVAFYRTTEADVNDHMKEPGLYVFIGGLGGEPDEYYRPTIFTVANPYFRLSKQLRINQDCIVMANDSMFMGLLPMLSKHATAMAETELSMKIALVNSRLIDIMTAPDERAKQGLDKFLRDVEAGELASIEDGTVPGLLEGIRTLPYSSIHATRMTDLIEMEQYWKASLFNELGLNANYNMKREAINSGESQLNDDALMPLVDNMLLCRQYAAKKINAMFGTEISVELSSAWLDNQQEVDAEQDILEAEGGADDVDPEEEAERSDTVVEDSRDLSDDAADDEPEPAVDGD